MSLALVAMLAVAGIAPSVTQAQLDPNDGANQPAEIEPLAGSSLLLDLAVAGRRLVAVGERGHVMLSDDQGATWRQAKSVPTRVLLTAVFFVDAEYGWAVGHDETILNTADGGETWIRVAFRARSAAAAAGSVVREPRQRHCRRRVRRLLHHQRRRPPLVQRQVLTPGARRPRMKMNRRLTTTSIASWASATACTWRPRAGSSIAPTTVARAGACLPSPYTGSFFGLVPIRGEGLLAFGLRGHLFRSADAGETWHELESHTTAMLTDGIAINDLRVVIGGLAGVLLVSADAGETFKLTQQDDRKGMSALLPGPAGTVVVAGEGGVRTIRVGEGS